MQQDEKFEKNDIDWENRVLCTDGNCIGVIGADGKCKECGLSADENSAVEAEDTSEISDASVDENDVEDGSVPSACDEEKAEMDDDWDNRVLCSDDSCIGTIGPDGTCNECGKPSDA